VVKTLGLNNKKNLVDEMYTTLCTSVLFLLKRYYKEGAGGFNKNVYYYNYLGDQMAGKPNNTKAQFVRP